MPTAVVVALVDFAVVVLGPKELDPYDLLPVAATLLVCLVHHRSWQLAEVGARTDPMTGLGNRRRLAEETARLPARRRPAQRAVGRPRRFKAVNDGRGHAVGDALLVEIAERLRAGVRGDDLVCGWAATSSPSWSPGPRPRPPRSRSGCRTPSAVRWCSPAGR